MITITVPESEYFDNETQTFMHQKEQSVTMEHSLLSLSKWESKWCKPFLTKEPKTFEESIDYFKCMAITPNVDPGFYSRLTNENIEQLKNYIDAPMTATTFTDRSPEGRGKRNNEQVTSELIYYWMVALTIPFECQKWHLNRLLTLIRICNIKNDTPKKMPKKSVLSQNKSLNAARRAALGTKG